MATKSAFPVRVLMFLSLLGLLLAGCASGSSSGGASFKTDKGIDTAKKEISLGVLTPLSGPVAAPIGVPLTKGIEVYFKYLNDNGGIGGYKVKLIEKDSKYDPTTHATEYNNIHNDVLMLAESLGTPTTYAIKDLATADQMLVTAATLDSGLAREPYMVMTGTPYRLQFENAADYLVNPTNPSGLALKSAKVGIIYQNDQYGRDGLKGYTESLDAYKQLTDVGQKPFAATDTDFSSQVLAMKGAGAQYVFLTCTPTATAKIVGTGHALGYDPQWILQSPAFATALLSSAVGPLLEAHAWVVSQGAIWGDNTKPGMVEMLANVTKYQPSQQPDGYFQYGYATAKITTAILQKAYQNGDMTRAGLKTAFESLRFVDLGGLLSSPSYGSTPDQRVPTRDSQIFGLDHTQPGGIKVLSVNFVGDAARASKF